jgi:glucose-1-phosphate cytidylyltransferase
MIQRGVKIKAVIFCGGQGTRLREETEFKPKPLVEIGGKPIIWHIMKIYSHYGIKEFILPLGYKGELIKDFFVHLNWRANDFTFDTGKRSVDIHKNSEEDNWKIHFVDTGIETGTGLRLKKIKHLIKPGETFMVTYGDGISDVDISKLLEFHKKEKRIGTITAVNVSSLFGVLNTKGAKLTGFVEKPDNANLINAGFMVFDYSVFDYLDDENIMFEAPDGAIAKLTKKSQISVYQHKGFWQCMDTYRDYLKLNKMWDEGDRPWEVWKKG